MKTTSISIVVLVLILISTAGCEKGIREARLDRVPSSTTDRVHTTVASLSIVSSSIVVGQAGPCN
jgi:hypothetical protein